MKYLIIYQNGKEERFYAKTFMDFVMLLQEGVGHYGPFDMIYCLGMGR